MTRASTTADGPAPVRPFWHTGTVEDEFTAVYMAMAAPGKYHPPIPPPMVDLMDLSTIAALMGVGSDEADQRAAHDRFRAEGPEVPMVPKSRAEAADPGGAILPS